MEWNSSTSKADGRPSQAGRKEIGAPTTIYKGLLACMEIKRAKMKIINREMYHNAFFKKMGALLEVNAMEKAPKLSWEQSESYQSTIYGAICPFAPEFEIFHQACRVKLVCRSSIAIWVSMGPAEPDCITQSSQRHRLVLRKGYCARQAPQILSGFPRQVPAPGVRDMTPESHESLECSP